VDSVLEKSSDYGDEGLPLLDAVRFAWAVCPLRERRKLLFLTFVLSASSILDVVGVLALSISSAWLLASSANLAISNLPVNLPGLDLRSADFDPYRAGLLVLSVGVACLLVRTILSIMGTRLLVRTAYRANEDFSNNLYLKFLLKPKVWAQFKNGNEIAYALNYGATGSTALVLTSSVLLGTDGFLVAVLAVTICFLSPIAAGAAAIVFGLAGFLLVRKLIPRTQKAAGIVGNSHVLVDAATRDGVAVFREGRVLGTSKWLASRAEGFRSAQLRNIAQLQYLLILPRFAAEVVLVVSLVAVGGAMLVLEQGPQVAALLVAYAAAASRIMPAVIRIQSALVQIRMGSGQGLLTYRMASLIDAQDVEESNSHTSRTREGSEAKVFEVRQAEFSYSGASWILGPIDLVARPGEFLALVGPSGSGKSTLADLILGVVKPNKGDVAVFGFSPTADLFAVGGVAYVPQDSWILHASIRENVSFGRPIEDDALWESLARVGLASYVASLPEGLDTDLEERGGNLSGGQRQRLGLARALAGNPNLLVLDEATSALDAGSESEISSVLQSLRGRVTVLVIAHRLQTVVHADQVVYMDGGKVMCTGTFEEVRIAVPDFATQARLLGLD
jgi:ABC-type multidrug transport system fused ATPase/permease subunit